MAKFPMTKTLPYQLIDKIACFSTMPYSVLFDSSAGGHEHARYTFVAIDPFLRIKVDDMPALDALLAQYTLESIPGAPPFQGGLAGVVSYDYGRTVEPFRYASESEDPTVMLGLYDLVLAFDHTRRSGWIFSSGFPKRNEQERYKRAIERIEWVNACFAKADKVTCDLGLTSAPFEKPSRSTLNDDPPKATLSTRFSKPAYLRLIERAKQMILAGDIFEVNLAQCFMATFEEDVDSWMLYLRAKERCKAPFSAYVNWPEITVVSCSPERFIEVRDRCVETRPIKGTAARHKDKNEDIASAKALQTSEKDRAENIMIVDLMRNDLSKVCKPHSICVPSLCALETFETVHHLVSVVQGTLRADCSALDVLNASFPAGSITGAPKVRAMEIIDMLEQGARGVYCGSALYIGFDGTMDSSVLIRTMIVKGRSVRFHAGGAVVLDSEPEKEYEEVMHKAAAFIELLT